MFLNRSFDYLTIGGGLSLITVAALALVGQVGAGTVVGISVVPVFILFFNSAHFAASTVRLYTKPGAFRLWPFLTMGLPLASIAVLTSGVLWPERIGWNLFALYLTWSPFHYAAQAFGLACMYHYRSGGKLDDMDRRLLYWTCMLPFLYAFFGSTNTGIRWFLPSYVLFAHPTVNLAIGFATQVLRTLTFVAPVALAVRLVVRSRRGLPAISWLIVLTNGIWWVVFSYYDAFVWATVFHGVQYLAIVMIFHVKDQAARPDNRHSPLYHALWFYGASLLLGYLVFYVWPYAYVLSGFGFAESILMCVAVINIHHFVVDRYIWKLRRDPNYQLVAGR